jgi:CDP-glycerol glycerophosphotransferase
MAGSDSTEFPRDAITVEPNASTYGRELGRAGYVVANTHMPGHFQKSRGVTYLQTYHGTPLKRLGHDNAKWQEEPAAFRQLVRDVSKWDYLISPNRHSTECFRTAFGFEGEVIESGYPRNDVLSSPNRDQIRRRTREQLGLSDDHRVVLYAPTWRDTLLGEHGVVGFRLALDTEELSSELGPDQVLLLRLHHSVVASLDGLLGPRFRDVSAYPDIRDLYLAADVLLTDYSSAMFDFAVTGKPIVFFVYDLGEYRAQRGGFYFDFESLAPGPLCGTTAEVGTHLLSPDRAAAAYSEKYSAFRKRFCYLDDGEAARRVVDRVFARVLQ